MKIKLKEEMELVIKKDCVLEDIVSFREVMFYEGDVLYFEGYDSRWSDDKVCVMKDNDCNRYLCGKDDVDEMFEE